MKPGSTPNHLVQEKSPYLLQHAYNPVNWYPWGEAAFERARKEDKPIFLSIGYSTCHWCHVMERESFEDQEVAEFLDKHFVSIKVDREERPDVDAIYMAAVQAMSGQGGWPMTVFLTPELKPFFGSTYFPPKPAYGRPSFKQLIAKIADVWEKDKAALVDAGETLTDAIAGKKQTASSGGAAKAISEDILHQTYTYFVRSYDDVEGGFGNAPKFPRPVQYEFLFSYYARTKNEKARDMALFTLRKMALGGMHDHLGGGFHRYSVDRYWRVSHFEKMLYDNGQLLHSYLDAWQLTHEEFFSDVAHDIIGYVRRDMTHSGGAFYSAEDADSEGEEGTFYVWTSQQIRDLLGIDDAKVILYYYGFMPQGNFEHGKNVLHVSHTIAETASVFERSEEDIRKLLDRTRSTLAETRSKRVRPHLDDKILTSWNGLMLGAIARAGDVLECPEYIEMAERAGEFIWQNLYQSGKLLHRWRDGEAKFDAYLESYAFLIKGYLELFRATQEGKWLDRSIVLQAEQDAKLWDATDGGYFMGHASKDLVVRTKNEYDGAEPSGNSVSVHNLLQLLHITGNTDYREKAGRTIDAMLAAVGDYPFAMPLLVSGIGHYLSSAPEIVLSADSIEALGDFRKAVNHEYIPGSVLVTNVSGGSSASEFSKSLTPIGGKPTAYICRDFSCELPVTNLEALKEQLARL